MKLSASNVTVRAARGRQIISDVSITLNSGRSLGVTGPSGAGKSSLLFALSGLQGTSNGEIRWGDTDITTLAERELSAFRRQHFGMIFQDHLLFDALSPLENASIADLFDNTHVNNKDHAAHILTALGVPKDRNRTHGLSGGERQRVAIARALANAPSVVLADEPTASLDRNTSQTVMDALLEETVGKDRSLLIVSHDPLVLDRMSEVIHLKAGERVL
ncbi:MAG: ABC transporter ATP-binding protein [Pseudomonadota bacterium]